MRAVFSIALGALVTWAPLLTAACSAEQRLVGPAVSLGLTVIPPPPVSDMLQLDVRGAVYNQSQAAGSLDVAFYLDQVASDHQLHGGRLALPPRSAKAIRFRWSTAGIQGKHRILMVAQRGEKTWRTERPLTVLSTGRPSTGRLGGAWVDIFHHDPREGKPFNQSLQRMTAQNWRELVEAMHAVDQDLIVITMMFQNFTHCGQHKIETEGYPGRAYYPSKLYSKRMPIACPDPLETILSTADKLDMYVMPGVGCYAFFDYTAGSLRWHQRVAKELWQRYGHHRSFYGWYVSEEKDGGLGGEQERQEIVAFFRQFTPFVRGLAPEKPVMLATNCFHLAGAEQTYRQLLPHLDILAPFGFHRVPREPGDKALTGQAAAALLQQLCDEAGCHLWMDLESFVFRNGVELHPRPIRGLIDDLARFPDFEKTLHYQFPGLMSSPRMSRRPGGEASVKLYVDYQRFLDRSPVPWAKCREK